MTFDNVTTHLHAALSELNAERDAIDIRIKAAEAALSALATAGKSPKRSFARKAYGAKTNGAKTNGAKTVSAAVKGSINTRTDAGRIAFDAAVIEAIKSAGGKQVRAEQVKKTLGGTAAQLRAALNRHIAAGLITYEGQARGTKYSIS